MHNSRQNIYKITGNVRKCRFFFLFLAFSLSTTLVYRTSFSKYLSGKSFHAFEHLRKYHPEKFEVSNKMIWFCIANICTYTLRFIVFQIRSETNCLSIYRLCMWMYVMWDVEKRATTKYNLFREYDICYMHAAIMHVTS